MLVQTENKNYLRETGSRALINNNTSEFKILKAQRVKELQRISEIDSLKQQIEELKKIIGAVINV